MTQEILSFPFSLSRVIFCFSALLTIRLNSSLLSLPLSLVIVILVYLSVNLLALETFRIPLASTSEVTLF